MFRKDSSPCSDKEYNPSAQLFELRSLVAKEGIVKAI